MQKSQRLLVLLLAAVFAALSARQAAWSAETPAAKPPADTGQTLATPDAPPAVPAARADLQIQVLDRAGQPLAGVVISVQAREVFPVRSDRETKLYLTTDAQGHAVLKSLKPRGYQINLQWPDFLTPWGSKNSTSFLQLRPGLNRVQHVLMAPGAMKGTVLSARDLPLKETSVFLLADRGQGEAGSLAYLDLAGDRTGRRASADREGRFNFDRLAEGGYFLLARHADYAPLCRGPLWVAEGRYVRFPKPLNLPPAADAFGAVSMTVLKAKGVPDANREVLLIAKPEDPPEWFGGSALAKNHQWFGKTDAQGHAMLSRLRPGRYYVELRSEGSPPLVYGNVAVAVRSSTKLEGHLPGQSGNVAGRVQSARGGNVPPAYVEALRLDDPEARRTLAATPWWVPDQGLQRASPTADPEQERLDALKRRWFAWTDATGSYKLSGLPPGEYVLRLNLGEDRAGLAGGIVVSSGQTAEAPLLVLPADGAESAKYPLKGKIRLPGEKVPGEKAADEIEVGLYSDNGRADVEVLPDGTFRPRMPLTARPEFLFVRHKDCRLLALDLRRPGLDLADLSLSLQPKAYGGVRVEVKRPDGQSLSGATVVPLNEPNLQLTLASDELRHAATTDARGVARLTGLAIGPRRISVIADDFYLPQPVEIEVKPGEEVEAAVAMKPLVALEGSVELPKSVNPSRAILELMPQRSPNGYFWTHTAALGPDGRFRFPATMPGKARLRINHPELALEGPGEIQLSESAGIQRMAVRVGSLQVDLGKAWREAEIALYAPGSWNPAPAASRQASVKIGQEKGPPQLEAYATIDSRGQAELRGLRPGTYDLLVSPTAPRSLRGTLGAVPAAIVVPGVKVLSPDGAKPAPFRPELAVPGGQVTVQLAVPNWRFPDYDTQLDLVLLGERGLASVTVGGPLSPSYRPPVKAGRLPEGLTIPQPGRYAISGLVPGEYRVWFRLRAWPAGSGSPMAGEEVLDEWIVPDGVAQTVIVTSGKPLVLEGVRMKLPDAVATRLADLAAAARRDHLIRFGRRFGGDGEVMDEDLAPAAGK